MESDRLPALPRLLFLSALFTASLFGAHAGVFAIPTGNYVWKEHGQLLEDGNGTAIPAPSSVVKLYEGNSSSGKAVAVTCNGTLCALKTQSQPHIHVFDASGPIWDDSMCSGCGQGYMAANPSTPIIDANADLVTADSGKIVRFRRRSGTNRWAPVWSTRYAYNKTAVSIIPTTDGSQLTVLTGATGEKGNPPPDTGGPVTTFSADTGRQIGNSLYPFCNMPGVLGVTPGMVCGTGTPSNFYQNTNSACSSDSVANVIYYVGQNAPQSQPNGAVIALQVLSAPPGVREIAMSQLFSGPSGSSPMCHNGIVYTDVGSCHSSGSLGCGTPGAGVPGVIGLHESDLSTVFLRQYDPVTKTPPDVANASAASFVWVPSLNLYATHQKNQRALYLRNPLTGDPTRAGGGITYDTSHVAESCKPTCLPGSDLTITHDAAGNDVAMMNIRATTSGNNIVGSVVALNLTSCLTRCASSAVWEFPFTKAMKVVTATGQYPLLTNPAGGSEVFFGVNGKGPFLLGEPGK